jgi:hypothetical protein
MFDINNGQCRSACDRLSRQACLVETGMCRYNDVEGRCEMLCSVKYNSTTTATTCNADAMCMYDDLNTRCRQRCISYSSQGTCITVPMCKWDADTNLCSKKCDYVSDETTCTMDTTCDYIATRATTKCMSQCVYRYSDPDSCNGDAECMWDGSVTQCADRCPRLDEGLCRQQQMCMYDVSEAIPCRMSCEYLTTQGTCGGESSCAWSSTQNLCYKLCPLIFASAN